MKTSALALRVTLYFARNPDEELTTPDIGAKFELTDSDVHSRLARPVKHGLLARSGGGPGRGRLATYSAGPHLLALIGQPHATAPTDGDDLAPAAAGMFVDQQANAPLSG